MPARLGKILLAAAVTLAGRALTAQTASQAAIRSAYEAGEQAMRGGHLEAAEKEFEKVLAAAPADAGAHTNLGVVYMRQQKWKPALAELRTAEELAPNVPGIRLNIGLVYYRQGQYGDAGAAFRSVVSDQPQSTQARRLLGLCYFFTEHYAEAAAELEGLWPKAHDDLSYLYVLALASSAAHKDDLEHRALAQLLAVGQGTAEYHLFIGKAYLHRQLDDRAFDELTEAARLNPKLPFVHYNLGVIYRHRGELDKAKQEFLEDVRVEPDVAYNYDQLGIVCQATGDDRNAEPYYERAVKLDKTLPASWYGLAKIYSKQKKYTEALHALDAAGGLDPLSASVHYLRGQILSQLGRREQARAEMAEVRRLKQATVDKLERAVSGSVYHDPELSQP